MTHTAYAYVDKLYYLISAEEPKYVGFKCLITAVDDDDPPHSGYDLNEIEIVNPDEYREPELAIIRKFITNYQKELETELIKSFEKHLPVDRKNWNRLHRFHFETKINSPKP